MSFLRIWLILGLFATSAAALEVISVIQYKTPVTRLQGRIVDAGGMPVDHVGVGVFTNPGVLFDDSLTWEEKRSRQKEIFGTMSDANGNYTVKMLPKGSYDLYIHKGGFTELEVIVEIDTSGRSDKLCVTIGTIGASGPAVKPCRR